MKPTKTQTEPLQKASQPPARMFYLTLDPFVIALLLISFVTRFYNLSHPHSIVFDELHYIKFVTLYSKGIFFFDPQPPFGKQLMTLAAHLIGFEGDLSYSQIGESYKPNVPIQSLRLIPCIAGSLLSPLSYLISLRLGFRQTTSSLVAALIILENSLLTQSRFILLEPFLILLSMLSIYCYLRFTDQNCVIWLSLSSISAALAFCTRYSGLYTYTLLLGLVSYHWWTMVNKSKPRALVLRTLTYILSTILLPFVIYLSVFYVHLSWLTKAGPHDSMMTSAFQASLGDGLATIARGQPLEILHGSQITLRHTHGRSCWLHSHEDLYPLKYSDGRGSSHQQQVTCYSFKDMNNWWIIKRPLIDELIVSEPHDRIKDGDLIQLVHGLTGRYLNSHDVASPMSPYSQEVSCYVDHNISMPALNIWQVRLENPRDTNGYWHTLNSRLQLIHYNTSSVLRFSGKQLPAWGFHQHEVVANKEVKSDDSIWNVEEHRYTKSDDQKEREREFGEAEFIPLEPTPLTFFEKFYEIHYKLLEYKLDVVKGHIYACESPLDWILMSKGTAYWIDISAKDNAQIFLIGNVATSYIGIISIGLLSVSFLYHLVCQQRKLLEGIGQERWNKISTQTRILVSGYLIHLIPYFFYESPLFLQYYLNALVFKIISIGALTDHLYELPIKTYITHALAFVILAVSIDNFMKLSPLSYGSSLTREQVESLKWRDTWQLLTAT